MVIGTRKGLDTGVEMNIQVEEDQLKVTYSFRYLGLTIDSQFSWKQHITQLIERVCPKIALMTRVTHRFAKILLTVFPVLGCGCVVRRHECNNSLAESIEKNSK